MKVGEVEPEVRALFIEIEGVHYKNRICTTVTVEYLLSSMRVITATCDDPNFIMGSSFWTGAFGSRQTGTIKRMCNRAAKKFLAAAEAD
jgi:hypothetical protein